MQTHPETTGVGVHLTAPPARSTTLVTRVLAQRDLHQNLYTHHHVDALSLLQHIRSWSWDERWVGLTAHEGRSDQLTRTRL
jgi:hypothetical protein